MFFMVTYGSLCLISFFQHFSGDPAYRPSFRSKWYISLLGGIVCFFLMFKMNSVYALLAITVMVVNYFAITLTSSRKEGLAFMVQNVISQFARRIMIFLQKAEKEQSVENWRPSVICLSQDSFKNLSNFNLMKWIADKYGFGTYIHLIDGYFSTETQKVAKADLKRLIKMTNVANSNFYVDTLISPSFTSAIAQIVQLPGISGQDNNMILFDYVEGDEKGLTQILENYGLLKAASFDTCILKIADRDFGFQKDIHIWMSPYDLENANLTVILGYILLGHNDWKNGQIKVFAAFPEDELLEQKEELDKLIVSGRLPVSKNNLLIYPVNDDVSKKDLVNKHSSEADLVIMGISENHLKQMNTEAFTGYENVGNVLFAHSNHAKKSLN
jgi:solute carrier family 12 sodium/potassium/chloride transporter 2